MQHVKRTVRWSLHRRHLSAACRLGGVAGLLACSGADSPRSGNGDDPPITGPRQVDLSVVTPNAPQSTIVGTAFEYDASRGNTVFADAQRRGLTYRLTLSSNLGGLSTDGSVIRGIASVPGVARATLVADNGHGETAVNSFAVVAFAAGLSAPALPDTLYFYRDPLPEHFIRLNPRGGPVQASDTRPATDSRTDAVATLGRVLFYDPRLSANDRVSCGTCHQQRFGFTDTLRRSVGFAGGSPARRTMSLTNARFYRPARFLWDERAGSLNAQVLLPIHDAVEMGLPLDDMLTKVSVTPHYGPLFTAAFGTPGVTQARVAQALSEFVLSLMSYRTRFDGVFTHHAPPFSRGDTLTALEGHGMALFTSTGGCAQCHATHAQVALDAQNNGLDASMLPDGGVANGRFKVPSLRNVAVRPPYMHDGRFATLAQVVEHYNSGVAQHPSVSPKLVDLFQGLVIRRNFSQRDKDALVAFLTALTDSALLTDPRFASPFPR